ELADARFSDGRAITAGDVVWSWQRALRPSTGAADLAPLAVIAHGAELARGALLRVAADVRGRPAPYPIDREGPGDGVADVALTRGTAVRVVDTNEREPCCRNPVALHASADV